MSGIRKCGVCGIKASRVCETCKKNFCGKKHLKSHKSSCLPSTDDLSTEEIERIQKLAIDMDEASFETFCETLQDMLYWEQWDRDAQQEAQVRREAEAQGRQHYNIRMERQSVFARAEGGPAFVRALERHHARLCVNDRLNRIVMDVLQGMVKVSDDALSSIVKAGVCSVVVKCIRASQFNDVCESLSYRRKICDMFLDWLVRMPGSAALRKELINSGAIKIIIQWLEECFAAEGETILMEQKILNIRANKDALALLSEFTEHNFACKTMLVEIGGLQAIATVIRENWGVTVIQQACHYLLDSMYCRCQKCTESKFCNLCGDKAKLACVCSTVRYCSKTCQSEDWKLHKTLCKDSRHKSGTEIVDSTRDEYQLLTETGTIAPDDEVLCAIDVVERLRSASSINDVMRWLLVLARLPIEEILKAKGFEAVVHVMLKYEDIGEIQSRGCTFFVLHSQGEERALRAATLRALFKAGGDRAILRAMKKHRYDAKLQGSACSALLGLMTARGSDGRCILQEVQVHLIIEAMMQHKDDFSVQEGGCGALLNRLHHPEDSKNLVKAGAASAVAAASQKYWGTNVEIHVRASGFFTALYKGGNELRGVIGDE
jgi:hypothetical protein